MKITLMRHGKPELSLSGHTAAGALCDIIMAYDASGIADHPTEAAINAAKNHNIVVSSDLPRALQSAKALGVDKIHSADALFREATLPHFSNGSLKLPMSGWLVILRCIWFCGYSQNGETFLAAKTRAKAAAERLIMLAREFNSVLLVGHGFINYFIAKELLSNHWVGPPKPGRGYWEYGAYCSGSVGEND